MSSHLEDEEGVIENTEKTSMANMCQHGQHVPACGVMCLRVPDV